MSTWIELRCAKRSTAPWEPVKGKRCFSHDNNGPMGMTKDSQASVIALTKNLYEEAKKTQWTKTREGWICPFCSQATLIDSAGTTS